ncbi:CHAT domain-containing protein [Mitsuaria sp. GD03876]|uniref:CHAT domain-containing tetratricopeptide repeat protein n=1 Tax=Mitsuaria sp. GD03876 TaxID=2975399 RepID=UPI00244AB923|nr:CHAT domain-containing protein [Mitsuaria sp. GD03876]MDH0864490.1 CHAT domain-containing protein [Mitsuaria sp. GD03876]
MAAATLLIASPVAVLAQEDPTPVAAAEDGDIGEAYGLSADDARRLLAEPLPDSPDARYALLKRQWLAARRLEDRGRQIEVAKALVPLGRGRPDGEGWIRLYLTTEFTWGSSGAALAACEPLLADKQLSPAARAGVALRQTYFLANAGQDRQVMLRAWSRADALAAEALKQQPSLPLTIDRLQVRAETERLTGDGPAAIATLRQAVARSRELVAGGLAQRVGEEQLRQWQGWLDGSQGMLIYALVGQGRTREAADIAQDNLALWRAGQLDDGQGARWNYRAATALNASQQYEEALAAARQSEAMLARANASAASQTRWLARQEILRALLGLKRWTEADQAYRQFLEELGGDGVARTRAQDNRLAALLAAKSGRLDEALETAERTLRYRTRIYGQDHPQTRESAGVRAVVRLLRGDAGGAMSDYEQLFAATLDRSDGWVDLDARGFRGFVLGLAFDEFLAHAARRALAGEALPPAVVDRALQIADRRKLGSTQRALADSTARLLAATPALRALLDEEQTLRKAASGQYGQVAALIADEDKLRKELSTEAFKALPKEQRKPREDALKALRQQLQARQGEAATAREALAAQRQRLASAYPAYADLITPATPGAVALSGRLRPGEGLLVVQALEDQTLVWLLRADAPAQFRAMPAGAAALAARVTALRQRVDLSTMPAGRETPLAQALPELHALYRELLAPLNRQGLNTLIVAGDGPLAGLPLAALVTEPPVAGRPVAWLLRQQAVVQLPSGASLQALRRAAAPAQAPKALLGFGDPAFDRAGGTATATAASTSAKTARHLLAPTPTRGSGRYDAQLGFRYADIPPLPETRAELLTIARALGADPAVDLRLGAAATRSAVLATPLADRRVLAFATHGLMPGELPGISKPALAMAAEADEGASPLLELDDVLTLRMNAQWVLLSACNTAAGEQGGAAMSGLVRGFFFAGARSVLATHWAVESASAAALTGATLAPADTRAAGLRRAQLAMADGQDGQGRWTHPYYWAAYALFGDPAQ